MKKALVVAIVMVMGLGVLAFAGPMSGSWDTEICFGFLTVVQTDSYLVAQVSSLSSTLTVDYSVCGWEFESVTGFGLAGWETQEFTAGGVMGAFTFGSTLVFDPSAASFTYWDSTGAVSIAGVGIDGQFILTSYGSGWIFGIDGSAGLCDLSAKAYFNAWPVFSGWTAVDDVVDPVEWDVIGIFPGYCFCFDYVEFEAGFSFCCVDEVTATVGFSLFGFEGVTFSVAGVTTPGIAWLTWDLDLTFDDGPFGKVLEITPSLDLGDWACIELEVGLTTSTDLGYVIDGLDFYGVKLECELGQGVTFSSHSYLDWPYHHFGSYPFAFGYYLAYTEENDTLIDATFTDMESYVSYLFCSTYWEEFTISSEADACCGGGFGFDLAVYFGVDPAITWDDDTTTYVYDLHSWLFDVAKIDASFSVGIGSNFGLTGGLVIQDTMYVYTVTDGKVTGTCEPVGLSELCIGFEVTF